MRNTSSSPRRTFWPSSTLASRADRSHDSTRIHQRSMEVQPWLRLSNSTPRAQSLKEGVDILANAVKTTLGPKGRNVALDKKYGAPTVTHDGVTVAKEIELDDPFANMGAQLLKEAATKTNDVAGDGTTTATVLAQAIVHEGMRNVAAGANAMLLKQGIDLGAGCPGRSACRRWRPRSKARKRSPRSPPSPPPIKEIGTLIAEVMEKVGKDGVITVEESKGLDFETEYTEGMQIDRGYISPYFVTNPERMEAELDDPFILITDKKISAIQDILPVLEKVAGAGAPARDHRRGRRRRGAGDPGRQQAARHPQRPRGQGAWLRRPPQGNAARHRRLTGGQVISEEIGRKLDSATLEDLGRARRVVSTKDDTTFIEGAGDAGAIKGRIEQIRAQIETTTSRLRPREAAGAAGQAGRRRGGDQGRRRHRDRAQGEEAPRRGCAERDPRRGRRRHRPRRRRGPDQRLCRRSTRSRPRATSRPASTSCAARSRSHCAASPPTRARMARSSSRWSAAPSRSRGTPTSATT